MALPLLAYEIKSEREVSRKKPVEISAAELVFDRLLGSTRFKGNVRAVHDDLILTADEIRALAGNREATAEGRVTVTDPTVSLGLTCGNLEYRDLMALMTAHEEPVLTSQDEEGKPITVTGRQMELHSEKKTVYIHQDVKMFHDGGHAEAGKATYLAKEDKFILEEEPKTYVKNGRLTGRRIVTKLGGENSILVEGMAEALFNPNGLPVVEEVKPSAGTPGTAPVGAPAEVPQAAVTLPVRAFPTVVVPERGIGTPGWH